MQDKQKVTVYLPPGLHRQLKIRAAVDSEPMSSMVEKAIVFYLTHPEIVEAIETLHGETHRIYNCPECESALVLRDSELVSLGKQPGVLSEEELPVEKVREVDSPADSQGEEELVPC